MHAGDGWLESIAGRRAQQKPMSLIPKTVHAGFLDIDWIGEKTMDAAQI